MIYETIDLYDYFSLPRAGKTGGILTVICRSPYVEIKEKIRPAMLVIAGGGYGFVSEREAEPIAFHFLLQGYATFSLKYSVNTPYPAPLLEAAMAMAFIRENAEKYGVDVKHVGAVGFSAGGHLTAMLATLFAEPCVKETLGKRAALARPDAVLLAYPVISAVEGVTHEGTLNTISGGDKALKSALSLETRVTKESSPAFIWHTVEDDCVPVENSLLLASAYRRCGVPFDLHIFECGWHGMSEIGFEVQDAEIPPQIKRNHAWLDLAFSFLKNHGFVMGVK